MVAMSSTDRNPASRGALTHIEDQSSDAAAGEIRVGVHGADARGVL